MKFKKERDELEQRENESVTNAMNLAAKVDELTKEIDNYKENINFMDGIN